MYIWNYVKKLNLMRDENFLGVYLNKGTPHSTSSVKVYLTTMDLRIKAKSKD